MTQNIIISKRLRLMPFTAESVKADMEKLNDFKNYLGAIIPKNWPPETLKDAMPFFQKHLESHPEHIGWLGHYVVLREENTFNFLIGSGGFTGPPTDEGVIEIGYSILPQFQNNGFASETVDYLIKWAFQQHNVKVIIATSHNDNIFSIKILEKHGFKLIGEGKEVTNNYCLNFI